MHLSITMLAFISNVCTEFRICSLLSGVGCAQYILRLKLCRLGSSINFANMCDGVKSVAKPAENGICGNIPMKSQFDRAVPHRV